MLAITETTSYHFCMPSSYIASSTCTHYPMNTWEICQKYIYGANPLHIFKNFYSIFYHNNYMQQVIENVFGYYMSCHC